MRVTLVVTLTLTSAHPRIRTSASYPSHLRAAANASAARVPPSRGRHRYVIGRASTDVTVAGREVL